MTRLSSLILGLAAILAGTQAVAEAGRKLPPSQEPAGLSVAEVIAAGTTDAAGLTTYVVDSIDQEYAVLAALGLEPRMQALVFDEDGTPYDLFETSGGPVRFDISSFFGQGL